MKGKTHRVGIAPMGDVDDLVLKVIAAHVSGYLNLSATILPPLREPAYALDKNRLQYDAGMILTQLEAMPLGEVDKVIAVLDTDLFVPIFTYVFGEARQGGNVALVSLFRLGRNTAVTSRNSPAALERMAKIALHELCHLYNLSHCMDKRCLMYFSGDIEQLDQIPLQFCRYCTTFFRNAALNPKPE